MKTFILLFAFFTWNNSFAKECNVNSNANTKMEVDAIISEINAQCLMYLKNDKADIQCLNTFLLPMLMQNQNLVETFPVLKTLNDEIGIDLYGQYKYFENIELKLKLSTSDNSSFSKLEIKQILEETLCNSNLQQE